MPGFIVRKVHPLREERIQVESCEDEAEAKARVADLVAREKRERFPFWQFDYAPAPE